MSLPRLKGAISGPIRAQAYCNSCTFFSQRGEGGVGEARCPECMALSAVESVADDWRPGMTSRPRGLTDALSGVWQRGLPGRGAASVLPVILGPVNPPARFSSPNPGLIILARAGNTISLCTSPSSAVSALLFSPHSSSLLPSWIHLPNSVSLRLWLSLSLPLPVV